MYGMTREEAANKALLYDKLRTDLAKVQRYLESTMPGDAAEILRPVEWALNYSTNMRGC